MKNCLRSYELVYYEMDFSWITLSFIDLKIYLFIWPPFPLLWGLKAAYKIQKCNLYKEKLQQTNKLKKPCSKSWLVLDSMIWLISGSQAMSQVPRAKNLASALCFSSLATPRLNTCNIGETGAGPRSHWASKWMFLALLFLQYFILFLLQGDQGPTEVF